MTETALLLAEFKKLKSEFRQLKNSIESASLQKFSVEQAAAYLGRKPKTIYNLCSSGKLEGFKEGKFLYFRREELDSVYKIAG